MSLPTALAQKITPSSAAPVTVTAGGANWTYGSWVELLTATIAPTTIAALILSSPSVAGSTWCDFQIGVGAAGAETAISTYSLFYASSGSGPNRHEFEVPLDGIPTATRIAVRFRHQGSGNGFNVALEYYENFDSTHKSSLACNYAPNGAVGPTVAPGASWASGSFVEISSGLSGENAVLGVAHRPRSVAALYQYEIDLAKGAAGAEVVFTTLRGYASSGISNWYGLRLPAPFPIPPSTRISARTRHSVTGTTGIDVQVRYLGPTSLLPIGDPPGDGDPGTGTDPSADALLCGMTAPLTMWFALELDAGTVRWSLAQQPLNDPSTYHGGPKEPRLLDIGPMTHALSDWTGHFITGGTDLLVEDTDGAVRAAIAANTLRNKIGDFYLVDDDTRRAGVTAPHRGGNYVVDSWELIGDHTVRLRLTDRLGVKGNSLNLTKNLPIPTFNKSAFPGLPPELDGKAAPWPYGILSDEAYSMVGVVPVWDVGDRVMADSNTWYEGAIAGCATKGPISLFGSDGAGGRVKLDTSLYATDIAFPGTALWTTVTGVSTNYVVRDGRRWTTVYFRPGSVVGEAFRNRSVPVVCNLGGIEDVGDGTGDVITSLPRILVHLLTNCVLQEPPGDANWNTIPQIGSPAYSLIETASFETVKTKSEARLAGGYTGAFVLGWDLNQEASSEWIARICLGGDFDVYVNRHGQIAASIEDKTDTPVMNFDAVTDIVEGSYSVTKDWSKWANRIIWDHMKRLPPPAENTSFLYNDVNWLFAGNKNNDASLETAQRDIQRFQYEDWVTRDFTLAIPDNVGQHKLLRMRKAPDFHQFDVDLCGTRVKPGDLYTVKHPAGPVTTTRTLRCESHTLKPKEGRVTLVGHDLADL